METRVKEGVKGEQKRGISLSKKSPSSSKLDTPNKGHNSTTGERSIPNYLKPTISSGLDPSKPHVKKNPSSDIVHKASVTRRRSLEKPLPPSHMKKPQISPNTRERNTPSSSFTSTTSIASEKFSFDRLSKAPKHGGKEHSLHPRPKIGKDSSITLKKQETQESTFSVKPLIEIPHGKVDAPNMDAIPQVFEQQEKDLDSSITEDDEEIPNTGKRNVTTTDNILVLEDEVHVSGTQNEVESHAVQEVKMIEPSPILKDNQNVIVSATPKESEDKLQVKEFTGNHSEILEQHGEKERDMNHPYEEKVEEQLKVEVQKKEGENVKEDTSVQTLDEREEMSDGSQVFDSQHQIDFGEDIAKEVKQDTERATTKAQVVQGKKDAAVVSNDVIEETASKLREQRKNKVRALAGAFETVISLQDSK